MGTKGRRDRIDEFVERVVGEWPDIDPQVEAAVDRMGKITRHLDRSLAEHVGEHGLNAGEFKVLIRLRLAGPPHRLSPGEISRSLELSTGAMTNRLDGLESSGMVVRLPDPSDRRGVLVELTATGKDVIDRAIVAQAAREATHLGVLTEREMTTLNDLLRKLVLSFESRHDHATVGRAAGRSA
jgi:DNA-binding MarR family transcriptional regulator